MLRPVPGQHLHRPCEDGSASHGQAPAGDKEETASFQLAGPGFRCDGGVGANSLPELEHDMFNLVSS